MTLKKRRPRVPWTFDVFVGAEIVDSDWIGEMRIDRAAMLDSLKKWRGAAAVRAYRNVRRRLPDAIDGLVYAVARWEAEARPLSRRRFLNWIERQSWDPLLLAVPAVQSQIHEIRSAGGQEDGERLGRWLRGRIGRGRPRRLNHARIRVKVDVARRQLQRFADRYRRELKGASNRQAAWSAVTRRPARIVVDLKSAGLFPSTPPSPRSLKALAYALVAHQERSTPKNVERIVKLKS